MKMLAGFLLLAGGLTTCPAFAQVDLSGGWRQPMHEDVPAGQEIGGCLGHQPAVLRQLISRDAAVQDTAGVGHLAVTH